MILRDVERIGDEGGGTGAPLWRAQMASRLLRLMLHVGRARQLRDMDLNGVLGAMSLAHAIIKIRETLADTGLTLDPSQRQALQASVASLRTLSQHPQKTAALLEAQSKSRQGSETGILLEQATFALKDCAGLLALATEGHPRRQ